MGASIASELGSFDPSMSLNEKLARVRFSFATDPVINEYQANIAGVIEGARMQMVISGGEVYMQMADPRDRAHVERMEDKLRKYIAAKYPMSILKKDKDHDEH